LDWPGGIDVGPESMLILSFSGSIFPNANLNELI